MDTALALVVVLALLFWVVGRFFLRGAELSRFDRPAGEAVGTGGAPSEGQAAVLALIAGVRRQLEGVPAGRYLATLRRLIDEMFPDPDPEARFTAVDAGGVRAEWVTRPGADPARRLLYIHGGAFMMGSPRSHRRLTARFAAMTGGAVLAIDYRLMPEHRRMAGIEDCRSAYRWLLDHGPDGPGEAARVWVAGDSAGGNLTLSLIAWVRDAGLRAPDAAVALSPLTDATLGSPSLRAHVATDPMLGPLFGKLARVPRTLLLWTAWLQTRINPRDPVVSPVYGDLSRLPPVLVQASEVEMLRDDARRWVNRARAAGSPAQLQVWDHMVHVWQLFHPELAEGRAALDEVGQFLASSEHRGASPGAAPAAGA